MSDYEKPIFRKPVSQASPVPAREARAEALKFDDQKPDLSLVPAKAKYGIAKAMMYGAKKYGRNNYIKGMDWSRMIAAAERHLTEFNDGEDFDKESGLNHLYHAAACLAILIEFYESGVGNDDRIK